MKLKTLAAIAIVLAVLSAVVFWTSRSAPAAPADARVGQPLADATAIAKASKIILTDQGKTISLSRNSDGSWNDDSYFGLPADFSKIASLASDLTGAKVQRFVSDDPAVLARLEFKDTAIRFLDARGDTLWAVSLGKSLDSGGRFVRLGSEKKAYLADLSTWIDTEPKDWASTKLIDLKADDIAKVEIGFDQAAPVMVQRAKKDAPWKSSAAPAGKAVSADKVGTLLSSLSALSFSDTSSLADPQAAAAKRHLRRFVLTSFDGTATTVALGRQPEQKKPKTPATKPPQFDTVPAGPVFVFITSSDPKAPVNAMMRKRDFQIDEYTYTGLPQTPADLFEAASKVAVSVSLAPPARASPGTVAR